MSPRRSTRSKRKTRPIILPQQFGGSQPVPEALLTGSQTKQIQELIDLLRKNNLTELELERQGVRIRVRHEVGVKTVTASVQESLPPAAHTAGQPAATAGPAQDNASGMVTITSPIVGTFYRSPSPDADPYVEEGDVVKKGQVLCIVEAMKLMNEIESETDGRIVKILAESTKSVEYGQALFLIDPKATA
ncbi:acetyl-CoA carboxylase biotin carboxyl carrier protein [Nitrospira moscoviensis]|uniref:Biotin carboxyl carrier protein of acetyl-CoA carboxylase n=1 Tax=Nitrospira moscoviensis TaxID=42253 RepID=A0A0K2GC14_NITMO|nr:acetyl-CoA carboxylase biotin carboxyl carrier protein [Nitrospira moscoviensis]ALA58490.1 Biotin carboxyl carrier protein of acetyl-CoA carboxylase [Nitrospira moscoviensis]